MKAVHSGSPVAQLREFRRKSLLEPVQRLVGIDVEVDRFWETGRQQGIGPHRFHAL